MLNKWTVWLQSGSWIEGRHINQIIIMYSGETIVGLQTIALEPVFFIPVVSVRKLPHLVFASHGPHASWTSAIYEKPSRGVTTAVTPRQ